MEQKDEVRTIQLAALRSRMDHSLAEADRCETTEGELFMQSLIDDLDGREAKRKVG